MAIAEQLLKLADITQINIYIYTVGPRLVPSSFYKKQVRQGGGGVVATTRKGARRREQNSSDGNVQ